MSEFKTVFEVALKLNAILSHLGALQMEWGPRCWGISVSLKMRHISSDFHYHAWSRNEVK